MPRKAEMAEETPKKVSYITKLQEENKELNGKNASLEERLSKLEAMISGQGTPVQNAIKEAVAPDMDDRNEIVEACWGRGVISPDNHGAVFKRQLPKREALAAIVAHYKGRKRTERMVPKEDAWARKVNDATCYIKFTKDDVTGDEISSYKDVPLWLAAERIVNHTNTRVTLITKVEFDIWNNARMKKEREWQKSLTIGEIQKAITTLSRQADLVENIHNEPTIKEVPNV